MPSSLLKVAAFLPFIVSWPFSINSPFEWNTEVTAQPLKCTILLTLIIVFHSGTACVGRRWGEMWHGVASSVADSVSILPLNKCTDELNPCCGCGGGVNPFFVCDCGHLQKCYCHVRLALISHIDHFRNVHLCPFPVCFTSRSIIQGSWNLYNVQWVPISLKPLTKIHPCLSTVTVCQDWQNLRPCPAFLCVQEFHWFFFFSPLSTFVCDFFF